MSNKKICIISQFYPNGDDMIFSFVDQLVCQFADIGCECTVITPKNAFGTAHVMEDRVRVTPGGNKIKIFCPKYHSYPHRKIGSFDTYRMTMSSYYKAVKSAFKKYVGTADIIYAHFLNPSGIAAAMLGRDFGIPAYVACGESSLEPHKFAYNLYADVIKNNINGIIAVSSMLYREIRELKLLHEPENIIVVPNAVNLELFNAETKNEARKKLGFDENDFIIVFVGHFIERKGFKTLIDAAKMSEDWKCIFIGSENNTESVTYDKTLFRGRLSHDKLGTYMSASDVFVLPTRAEGCCNAIIEALASKLPVVSSDLPFNDDILDESCSIRINPESEKEVFDAVEKLRMNKVLCEKMSNAALKKAQTMSIQNRAERILDFMFGSRRMNDDNII